MNSCTSTDSPPVVTMNSFQQPRRAFLRSLFCSSLLGPGMLSELLGADDSQDPLAAHRSHTSARAKRVIFIYATGGVSHIDTFDPKTIKKGRDGTGPDNLMGNIFGSGRNQQCGTEVSDIFPHVRNVMDEICLIRTMKASHFDHSEATLGMHTGSPTFARPSMLVGELWTGHLQPEPAQLHRHRSATAVRRHAGLWQ